MAVGDEAAAAGMAIVAQTGKVRDGATEINRTRDYIAQRTSTVTPVDKGGTGGNTAAAARTNLDVPSKREAVANLANATNAIALGWNGGTFRLFGRVDATNVGELANVTDINNLSASITAFNNGKVNRSGDTITGNLFLPNSTAATSSWTNAYINGDGRVCRGASSERYKKFISQQDPMALGDMFAAPWVRYQMRGDGIMPADGKWHYGYIAESLIGTDLEPFVVSINGQVESIDFNGLLLAQTAQLHRRVADLEARLAALESS